ncbi:MAG: hypothetical protein JWN44_107 [Myxococcales bacterium]|nr:hypothetical protein [Myxococcales bacterium]
MTRALVFSLLFVSGCFHVDVDVTGFAASAGSQEFPSAGAAAGTLVEVSRLITFEPTAPLVVQLRAARIESVSLAPAAGVRSLDFLRGVTLTLHTAAGDVPLVDASGAMADANGRVRLPVDLDVDPSVFAAPLEVAASMRFVAPAGPWSMHVDAALTVNLGADIKP